MRNTLFVLLLMLTYNISSAQTGWGYVNYTSYKTHNGNGSTNQYGQFANTAAEFDNLLNTSNSNTTITHTGEVPISYLYNGSTQTPHWNADYYAIKFDFWFVPQQTGTYYFGINSDDASDLSINGTIVVSYYGGHGASSMQVVPYNMVAGQRYKIVVRYQEYGGGDALFFQWYRPVGGWGSWSNEVTNVGIVPPKRVIMNFDFGGTFDKTKLSVESPLNINGTIDVTNLLDTTKIGSGYKSSTTGGQVEWCVIYEYDSYNKRYRIGIDSRQMSVTASEVNQLKLFDLWDGPITFSSYDPNGWSEYFIYTDTPFNFSNSTYSTYIRNGGSYYALNADFTYTPTTSYKQQSVTMSTTNTLTTMYSNIVTVSDVYLAFKELANGGIFGNQTGNEFTYGIQFKNADVNDDGLFNESDTYRLLQHLTGSKNIVDTFTLPNLLKLIPTTTYNTINKSNWNTSSSYLGNVYKFDINTGKSIDTLNVSGTWKGDVNLSHSATPISNVITTNSLKTFSIKTNNVVSNQIQSTIVSELLSNKVYVTIKINPLQQEVVGVQFGINYDNTVLKFDKIEFKTKGNPMNFGSDKNGYINVGSIISDGSITLDNTTEYVITFTPITNIGNTLGLFGVNSTDAVNKNGTQLKIKLL